MKLDYIKFVLKLIGSIKPEYTHKGKLQIDSFIQHLKNDKNIVIKNKHNWKKELLCYMTEDDIVSELYSFYGVVWI